jgi:hypothetical protein
VFPPDIDVDGPRDVVNSMRTVRTMEIDVSKLEEGVVQREIPLVGPPANTVFEAQTVLVTLRVQAKMRERVLSPLRVDAEGVVPRALRPRAVTARVRGPESAVKELNPLSVLAIVNLEDVEATDGPVSAPVELRGLPDELEVVAIEPAFVTVLLPNAPSP